MIWIVSIIIWSTWIVTFTAGKTIKYHGTAVSKMLILASSSEEFVVDAGFSSLSSFVIHALVLLFCMLCTD